MCVFDSIELEPGATRTPEINPVNIINHEQQNEKPAASQFFRSLLDAEIRLAIDFFRQRKPGRYFIAE